MKEKEGMKEKEEKKEEEEKEGDEVKRWGQRRRLWFTMCRIFKTFAQLNKEQPIFFLFRNHLPAITLAFFFLFSCISLSLFV